MRCQYGFQGRGREVCLQLARYTHRRFLPYPMYLAHTYTASLRKPIPTKFQTITIYKSSRVTKPPNGTVPFDSSDQSHRTQTKYKTIAYKNVQNPASRSPSPLPPSGGKNRDRRVRNKVLKCVVANPGTAPCLPTSLVKAPTRLRSARPC